MTTITKIPFGLGQPQLAGPLTLYPIVGPEPRTVYRSLGQALKLGASVTEVDEQGSVGDVLVANPTDQAILIYEGEEIQGARQNRTFDAPALVPPATEVMLAVSCVEQGRWEGRRYAERFTLGPDAPDPELRRLKRVHANRSADHDRIPRADQHVVWSEVSSRLSAHSLSSATDALSDVYRGKRLELDELRQQIRHVPVQLGTVVAISGRPVALDMTSRSEVFADLLPRLTGGYALQALDAPEAKLNEQAAYGFLTAVLEAPRRWVQTPGMGDGFAISQPGVEGAGLAVGPELIALAAFPAAKR